MLISDKMAERWQTADGKSLDKDTWSALWLVVMDITLSALSFISLN